MEVGEFMSQELTFEIASELPKGTIIKYDQYYVSFGCLVRKNNVIYLRRFGAPNRKHQKKMWIIRNWKYYSIASKEEYVLWKLENL
jgi:hypothetical protein